MSALVTSMPGVILSQFEMHTSASAMRALHMYSTLPAMIGFGAAGHWRQVSGRRDLRRLPRTARPRVFWEPRSLGNHNTYSPPESYSKFDSFSFFVTPNE